MTATVTCKTILTVNPGKDITAAATELGSQGDRNQKHGWEGILGNCKEAEVVFGVIRWYRLPAEPVECFQRGVIVVAAQVNDDLTDTREAGLLFSYVKEMLESGALDQDDRPEDVPGKLLFCVCQTQVSLWICIDRKDCEYTHWCLIFRAIMTHRSRLFCLRACFGCTPEAPTHSLSPADMRTSCRNRCLLLFFDCAVDSITDVYTVSQLKQKAQGTPESFFGITYSFISKLDLDSSVSKVIRTRWCVLTSCSHHFVSLTPVSLSKLWGLSSLLVSAPLASSRQLRTCRVARTSCVRRRIKSFQPRQASTCWWTSRTTQELCIPAASEARWLRGHLAALWVRLPHSRMLRSALKETTN